MSELTPEDIEKAIAYLRGYKVTVNATPSKDTMEMIECISEGGRLTGSDEDIIIKK